MTRPPRSPITRFAVLLLGVSISLFSASVGAEAQSKAALTMRLTLRNDKGQVGCTLYNSAKGFPRDSGAALQRKWCGAHKAESVCRFDPIPAGTYAVACFHDENKNGKLDSNLFGIPSEGVVTSNNAKGSMGPPSFQDAKFSFSAKPTELRLTMNY